MFVERSKTILAYNRTAVILVCCVTLVILVYMFTAPVYVDEGWFHNLAKAKNELGYYTFPAFYDVPALSGHYTQGSSLFVQFYRLFDWLFPEGVTGIMVMRLLFLAMFVSALWLYISRLDVFGGTVGNVIVVAVILIQPVVLSSIARARSEMVMASLLLLVFWKFCRLETVDVNWNALLIFSITLFLIHPNGVLYFLLLMLLGAGTRNFTRIMQLWGLGLVVVVIYYLVFIDANFPLYKEQFKIMFSSGGERKFLGSLADVPLFIYSEIRDRYLLWEWRGLMSYPGIHTRGQR